MRVAIHQPHYFPWMGYFDKMAKVEKFIIMDDVQLVDSSPMVRNKFLDTNGEEVLLSLSVDKKGYLEKKCRDVKLINWNKIRKKHSKTLFYSYKKSEYFEEIWEKISPIFEQDFKTVFELQMKIIEIIKEILDIKTEILYQSQLDYDKESKSSDLVLNLCLVSNSDVYLSGNGGKKYMKLEDFKKEKVEVIFQKFDYPIYKQIHTEKFISKLSILDLLFNCGIKKGREIFWKNVKSSF